MSVTWLSSSYLAKMLHLLYYVYLVEIKNQAHEIFSVIVFKSRPPYLLWLLSKYAFTEYVLIVYSFTFGLSENIFILSLFKEYISLILACFLFIFYKTLTKTNLRRIFFILPYRNLEAGIKAEDKENNASWLAPQFSLLFFQQDHLLRSGTVLIGLESPTPVII